MSDTKRSSCEHGDCAEHYGDPTAWCDKCFATLVEADPRLTRSDTTTTTTVSEPRPVSALEQALRDMADNLELYNEDETWADGMRVSADLVHDRDAELFALVDEWRQIARNTVDPSCAASYRTCAANLVYRLTEKG